MKKMDKGRKQRLVEKEEDQTHLQACRIRGKKKKKKRKVQSNVMFVHFCAVTRTQDSVAVQVSRGFVQLAGRATVREQRCRRRQEGSLEERAGYPLTNTYY